MHDSVFTGWLPNHKLGISFALYRICSAGRQIHFLWFLGRNQEFGIMLNTIGRTDSRRGRFNSFHPVRGDGDCPTIPGRKAPNIHSNNGSMENFKTLIFESVPSFMSVFQFLIWNLSFKVSTRQKEVYSIEDLPWILLSVSVYLT